MQLLALAAAAVLLVLALCLFRAVRRDQAGAQEADPRAFAAAEQAPPSVGYSRYSAPGAFRQP